MLVTELYLAYDNICYGVWLWGCLIDLAFGRREHHPFCYEFETVQGSEITLVGVCSFIPSPSSIISNVSP